MISLLGKPILAYTVEGVVQASIKKLVMVVRDDGAVQRYFGDGKKFGVKIRYVVQKEPLGMGDALLKAAKFIEGDFVLLGGNHVNSEILIKELMQKKDGKDAVIMVKQRPNTWEYGVVELQADTVSRVVEKPKKGEEPSDYCLVSVYLLPPSFVTLLKKTKKHHYNFEEALDIFVKSKKVKVAKTKEKIATLKYPWDLLRVKNHLLQGVKRVIGKDVAVAKSAEIIGEVVIEDGATIMEGVRIKGPCYLGKNVVIGNNAFLRNGVDVEEGATVGAYMEVKNSLIMRNAGMHSGFIGDSIIGENSKIGAQFCTANVRIDRQSVKAVVKDQKVDTGQKFLGAIIGNNVKIGIKASTMPGIIIGNDTVIGPSTTVIHNVADNTRYYTKFREVVEEK